METPATAAADPDIAIRCRELERLLMLEPAIRTHRSGKRGAPDHIIRFG